MVSIEHLRRVWHAERGRLLLRTPGPVPLGLAYVLLVETNPFPNLSLFCRTMLFEYPSVLSRFCFILYYSVCSPVFSSVYPLSYLVFKIFCLSKNNFGPEIDTCRTENVICLQGMDVIPPDTWSHPNGTCICSTFATPPILPNFT